MGVPAFFRWLSRKYPSIVANCVEDKPKDVNGVTVPVDCTLPNPNGVEFDNLYLDMNGIVHPCTHPEDRPAPKNEAEMMVAIFDSIDRLFRIVRPRRLIYMAVDGVAPRAKMNQQRSRRFRAAKEAREKRDDIERIRQELDSQGIPLPPAKAAADHFDSNCITPGTPFMARLSDCLRYYIHDRLTNDPAWSKLVVILSDANVPGEGEHKIMDFIRKQRASPNHDPNTHHVLCGADADLIMLGLATHEPSFTIIREEFVPNQQRPCELCGQFGHEMRQCQGLAKIKTGEYDEVASPMQREKNYIFIRLNVLREYLQTDLYMPNLPFKYDFERAIDDWVFMCFFVGNDFLPHLPSLEIRENAIDRLIKLYKTCVYKTKGYLAENGIANLSRVQMIMKDLGEVEDEIFRDRQQNELERKFKDKQRKKRLKAQSMPSFFPSNEYLPKMLTDFGGSPLNASNLRRSAYDGRMNFMQSSRNLSTSQSYTNLPSSNNDAARQLKNMLSNPDLNKNNSSGSIDASPSPVPRGQKRKRNDEESDEEQEPQDEVRLWEAGWKERYYQAKFEVSEKDAKFRYNVANAYVEGLCWVLRYYYQGCCSWVWYFPYHYAPFASDFVNLSNSKIKFDSSTRAIKPLEQLMSVFPAASRTHVPEPWARLMIEIESPIIDFYPADFKIDLNGKKFAWQGVALLPFVDAKRLDETLKSVYDELTDEEKRRNTVGYDSLFLSIKHPFYSFVRQVYESSDKNKWVKFDGKLTFGMSGLLLPDERTTFPGQVLKSPLNLCADVPNNNAIGALFCDPQFDASFVFPSNRLPGAIDPPAVLKPSDYDESKGQYRPQIGFTRNVPRASLSDAGKRFLKAGVQEFGGMRQQQMMPYGGSRGGYPQQNSYGIPGYYSAPAPLMTPSLSPAILAASRRMPPPQQRMQPPRHPGQYWGTGRPQQQSQRPPFRPPGNGSNGRPSAADYF